MTKREQQTAARRELQRAVQPAYDRFIDALAAMEGYPSQIATAAFRLLPDTIDALTDSIHRRREHTAAEQKARALRDQQGQRD
jgi:hypothetical protein